MDFNANGKPAILLVEDNVLNKELVFIYLRDIGILDHAPTGEAALEMIEQKSYDLFLMDINLGPGINGLEVTQKLRAQEKYKNTPVIAVTGYTSDADRTKLLDGGCSFFLPKPFSKRQLVEIVTLALA